MVDIAIVHTAPKPYVRPMTAALFRLLALVALVLMPIGMAGTPALAHPADHAMAAGEACPDPADQDQAPAVPTQQMHCAMCAALPAAEAPAPARALQPRAPRTIALVSPFVGIDPEIATPPPKAA